MPLVEFDLRLPRLFKHLYFIFKTIWTLIRKRPRILLIQCPSLVLGVLAGLLKRIFRFKLISDCHNEAVVPYACRARVYVAAVRFIHKASDLCIITNASLASTIISNGGKPFILPDKIPHLGNSAPSPSNENPLIVFICTYSPDEPYQNVIEAARSLEIFITLKVTGNAGKCHPDVKSNLPQNVTLTGYLSETDYVSLLSSADILMDLTEMDACLVCGAYEAVALGKPLITSDTPALREYFRRGTVYTRHDRQSLVQSIYDILQRKEALAQDMRGLKPDLENAWTSLKDELLRIIQRMEN